MEKNDHVSRAQERSSGLLNNMPLGLAGVSIVSGCARVICC